jgi:hypothetical protein
MEMPIEDNNEVDSLIGRGLADETQVWWRSSIECLLRRAQDLRQDGIPYLVVSAVREAPLVGSSHITNRYAIELESS